MQVDVEGQVRASGIFILQKFPLAFFVLAMLMEGFDLLGLFQILEPLFFDLSDLVLDLLLDLAV